jgi:hypothetical protein
VLNQAPGLCRDAGGVAALEAGSSHAIAGCSEGGRWRCAASFALQPRSETRAYARGFAWEPTTQRQRAMFREILTRRQGLLGYRFHKALTDKPGEINYRFQ